METAIDKDSSVYGGLFNTILTDLRGSSPIWEDFITKATKLHSSLKATMLAISAFLEAFQKVADMATNSRGATKEMGTALTRLCMRHKAIESKLKKFTGTILEGLVNPLQDSMEDWKKSVVQLDKDHAKEYKRARQEIKKCAADTVRLQKKVKKGKNDMQSRLDSAMHDVNEKYMLLEEQEKNAVRTALIEERGRFCHFVTCIKPFVDGEVSLLTEVTHLEEIMDHLCRQADEPSALPASSEQVIADLKGESGSFNFQVPNTPPSSPSSIGSRKSSMCSISSIASSSSGSAQSHSPCHTKNIQQQHAQLLGSGVRLTSVSSQDSGFTSQDTLFLRPMTPSSLNIHAQNPETASQGTVDTADLDLTPSTPSESYPNTPSATSTWTNWPNPPNGGKNESGRPHTISSAYEKSHSRPALSQDLFQPPPPGALENLRSADGIQKSDPGGLKRDRPHSTMSVPYSRPSASINKMQPVLPPLGPKPKSRAVAPPKVPSIGEQPLYANLSEISPSEEIDLDRTPTTRDPPSTNGVPQIQRNTLELQAAIKELEASTAALEGNYSDARQPSQASLQGSSGYGTMNSTPAGSKDTIASGGIPVSAQNQGALMRRSSMNAPKPPPPVRRSSSITSAPNSSILQKFRSSPPRQLNTQPPPSSQQQQYNQQQLQYSQQQLQANNTQPFQSNHRRSLSASGSPAGSEPAYAELSEIQQSIHARHQQAGYGGQSAPVTPQYSQPVTTPGKVMPQSNVINSLNAKFASTNIQSSGGSGVGGGVSGPGTHGMPATGHQSNCVTGGNQGPSDDFMDLPPPPTADELMEIEQIYSVPKQNLAATSAHSHINQTPGMVQMRPPAGPSVNPVAAGDMRQSLISEMKSANRFRKTSQAEDGSEC